MSKPAQSVSKSNKHKSPGYKYVKTVAGVEEYLLKINGLRVFYHYRADTKVVTSNITYLVGAKDEDRGETGLAHMLEHMLFKPTTYDVKKRKEASAMQFEREVGCTLNANTWKDRTTYYFTYPTEYLNHALQIEAERMTGTVLTAKELDPEKNNVLSEFDMNNGDPHFALAVQMVGTALQSHPYGHETIGYREDIEAYTPEKLEKFYRNYYRPDNAIMMIIGDVDKQTALKAVRKHFSSIQTPKTAILRYVVTESKQEGMRRVKVTRPGMTNIISFGFLHAGFPTKEWFQAMVACEVLAGNEESILHKKFIDTGKVSSLSSMMEPTGEMNLGMLSVTLSPKSDEKVLEQEILDTIHAVTVSDVKSLLNKIKIRLITEELFARDHSQHIAQELTEYVASGTWEAFGDTEKILTNIKATDVLNQIKILFNKEKLTIGNYTSK